MDPPPPPPPLTTTTAAIVTATKTYAESVDSSPRSRNIDSWDDSPAPAATKLRLMCSYNGYIVPRLHDKSLCYVDGDTRVVVVDRHTSLASLSSRLSRTLLSDRPFTIKYQLPSEDLDSLISVATDEGQMGLLEGISEGKKGKIKNNKRRMVEPSCGSWE